jgi:hypothetical protein
VIHNTSIYNIYTQQASVGDDNCAECVSVFVCNVDPTDVSGDGTDHATVEDFITTLPKLLAGLACGCAKPSNDEVAQFSVVQSAPGSDGLWCAELTILPVPDNSPGADTPATVLQRLESNSKNDDARETGGFNFSTDRPTDLPSVGNDAGAGGDDFPLLPVLLGISGFLLLLIAVYCLRRHIQKRYELKGSPGASNVHSSVRLGADGSVMMHKMHVDTATDVKSKSKDQRSRSIDDEITPPVDRERRPTVLPNLNDLNDIHVPATSTPGCATKIAPSGARITVMYHKPIVLEDFDENFDEY